MIFLNLICILITLIFDKKFFILYRKQYISCIYFVFNSFLFFSFILLSFFLNKNILENIFYFIFYFLFFFFLSFLIYINKIPEYLSIKVYFRNSYLLTLLVFNLSHILFFFFFFFNLKFLFFKFSLNLLFLTLIIYLLNFFQIYKINFLDFQIKSYWEWLLNKFAPQDSKQDFFFNLEINISNLFSFLSLILFLFYTPLILLNIKFINFFNFNFIYFIIYPIILITFINTFSMFLNILLKNKRIKLNFKILNKISLTFLFLIFWSFFILILLLKDFSYNFLIFYSLFLFFIYILIIFMFIFYIYLYIFPFLMITQIFIISFFFFIKIIRFFILNSFNFFTFFIAFNIFLIFFNLIIYFLYFYKIYYYKNKPYKKFFRYFIIKPHVNFYLEKYLCYINLGFYYINKLSYISPWFSRNKWDQELHYYLVLYDRHEMLNSIEIFFPYIRKFTDTTCHNSEFCLKFNNLNLLRIVYRFKKYKYLELISKIKEQKKILQIFYIKSKKKNFKILNLLKSCKILLLKNIQKLIFLNNNIIKSIFFLNKNPKLFLDKTIKTRIRHYEDEVNLFKFHHKFRLFCENNFNFYDTFLIFMNRYFNINLFFIYKFEKFK